MKATGNKFHIVYTADCPFDKKALVSCLSALHMQAELTETDSARLPAVLTEQPADAVILGCGQYDLAADLAERSYIAVLLMTEEEQADLRSACVQSGVLLSDAVHLEYALSTLLAISVRMRALRQKTSSLQRKLDDTRYVNRAKLLLMSRLQMSEAQAHRYIEKTAMDSGENRRDVAMSIIRTYEE